MTSVELLGWAVLVIAWPSLLVVIHKMVEDDESRD